MAPRSNRALLPIFEDFLVVTGIPDAHQQFYRHVFVEVSTHVGTSVLQADPLELEEFLQVKIDSGLSAGRQKAYRAALDSLLMFRDGYDEFGTAPQEDHTIEAQLGMHAAGTLDDDAPDELPGESTQAINDAPLLARSMATGQSTGSRSIFGSGTSRLPRNGPPSSSSYSPPSFEFQSSPSTAIPDFMGDDPFPDDAFGDDADDTSTFEVGFHDSGGYPEFDQDDPFVAQPSVAFDDDDEIGFLGADSFEEPEPEPAALAFEPAPAARPKVAAPTSVPTLDPSALFGDLDASDDAIEADFDIGPPKPSRPRSKPAPKRAAGAPSKGAGGGKRPISALFSANAPPPSGGLPGGPGGPGGPRPIQALFQASAGGGGPIPSGPIVDDPAKVAFSKLGMLQGPAGDVEIAVADDDEEGATSGPSLRRVAVREEAFEVAKKQAAAMGPVEDERTEEEKVQRAKRRLTATIERVQKQTSLPGRKGSRFRSYVHEGAFVIDRPSPAREGVEVVDDGADEAKAPILAAAAAPLLFAMVGVGLFVVGVISALDLGPLTVLGPIGWGVAAVGVLLCIAIGVPTSKWLQAGSGPLRWNTPDAALRAYADSLWAGNYVLARRCLAVEADAEEIPGNFDPRQRRRLGSAFNRLDRKRFSRYWAVHHEMARLSAVKRFFSRGKPAEIGDTRLAAGSVDGGSCILVVERRAEAAYWLVPAVRIRGRWYLADGQLFPRELDPSSLPTE